MTKDKIIQALAIMDGMLAILCLALAVRWVGPWLAVVQTSFVVLSAVAAFVVVVFGLAST
jgi:hypothetical protein